LAAVFYIYLFFSNQSSKVINNENSFHVPFSIALKSVITFTNAQDIMGEFVYAVTAAEGVILSLFTSNEQ